MKMAFEASILSYISMFFLSIGIVLMELVFTHQRAMQIEEYAVMMIEHHDRYDADVAHLIEKRSQSCPSCEVSVIPMYGNDQLRYEVKVTYEVLFSPLHRKLKQELYALTTPVSSS